MATPVMCTTEPRNKQLVYRPALLPLLDLATCATSRATSKCSHVPHARFHQPTAIDVQRPTLKLQLATHIHAWRVVACAQGQFRVSSGSGQGEREVGHRHCIVPLPSCIVGKHATRVAALTCPGCCRPVGSTRGMGTACRPRWCPQRRQRSQPTGCWPAKPLRHRS